MSTMLYVFYIFLRITHNACCNPPYLRICLLICDSSELRSCWNLSVSKTHNFLEIQKYACKITHRTWLLQIQEQYSTSVILITLVMNGLALKWSLRNVDTLNTRIMINVAQKFRSLATFICRCYVWNRLTCL